MNHDELGHSISRLVDQVARALEDDPTLRAALRDALLAFANRLGEAQTPSHTLSASETDHPTPLHAKENGSAPIVSATSPPFERAGTMPRPVDPAPAQISGPTISPARADPEAPPSPIPAPPPDLQLISQRARLKAEVCRWMPERRRRLAEAVGPDAYISEHEEEFIQKAGSFQHCYLWPLDRRSPVLRDEQYELLAECYENLSDAAQMALTCVQTPEGKTSLCEVLTLLAEVQSALRVALADTVGLRRDADQYDSFRWLGDITFRERIYVARFMRLEDPGDPAEWRRHSDDIASLTSQLQETAAKDREARNAWSKARYEAKKVAEDPNDLPRWEVLAAAVERLMQAGVKPSNVDLRELILPVFEDLPEAIASREPFDGVVASIDDYLASRESTDARTAPQRQTSPEVEQASALLRGARAVMIGGECRPRSRDAIVSALGLKELEWITCREHQSIAPFEAAIARSDTKLVMLAIRFSSHSFEGARDFCERYGKVYVRLPGGYGVNQVARQVLEQASEKLRQA